LQIMLDNGLDLDWFESNVIIALFVVSCCSFAYFIIWSRGQPFPIVDFSFFANRNFLFGTISLTLAFLTYFCSSIILPLWLQTVQRYTPYWAGVAIAPVGIAAFFICASLGKHMHRIDLRIWPTISFLFFFVGFFYQAQFTAQVSLEYIMWIRFLQGFGVAFLFLPLVQLALGAIPGHKYASASGVFHFVRILVSSGFGTSLSVELWNRRAILHQARLADMLPVTREGVYEALNQQFSSPIVTRIVNVEAESQAYLMAMNDLSWVASWTCLLLIPLLFLCKPLKEKKEASGSLASMH
jgi:DHA2 family multidrug resistance protein